MSGYRTAKLVAAILLGAFPFQGGSVNCAHAIEHITLQLAPLRDPQARASLFRYLDSIGQREVVVLDAGRSLEDLLNERCGFAARDLVEFVKTRNEAAVTDTNVSRNVVLPVCPFWQSDQIIAVPAGITEVAVFLNLAIGQSGPQTIRRVRAANPGQIGRDGRVKPGQKLLLPYTSRPLSFVLRSELEADRAKVVDQLTRRFQYALVRKPGAAAINLVRNLETGGGNEGREYCDGDPSLGQPWPFDRDATFQILQDNWRRGFNNSDEGRILITIADTGIERADVNLLPLKINQDEVEENHKDEDLNRFPDDRFGSRMDPRGGFPAAPASFEQRSHGMQVAGIALGGLLPDALTGVVREHLKLVVAGIVKEERQRADAGITSRITETAVENSLRYALVTRSRILNWSFQSWEPLQTVEAALETSKDLLVVVAAGNDGLAVDDDGSYPSASVRKFADRIITVGALAANDGTIADFSNFGPETIDIAAPGCGVDTISTGGKSVRMEGTSAAAPLVSFTAALLMAQGVEQPEKVKRRIVHTARLDPQLADVFRSSGWLDIPKAIAIADDIVETIDLVTGVRTMHRGRIVRPTDLWPMCDDEIARSEIIRIVPRGSNDVSKPTRVVKVDYETNSGDLLRVNEFACDEPEFEVVFEERVPGSALSELVWQVFDWSTIVDIVPALYPSDAVGVTSANEPF